MAASAPSEPARKSRRIRVGKLAQIVACVLITLPLALVADRAFLTLFRHELPTFLRFLRWPLRSLTRPTTEPGVYRGTLHSGTPRTTPRGEPAALYLAKVTRTEQSGRSTYERTVCEWNATDNLEFIETGSGATAIVELAEKASDWRILRNAIDGLKFRDAVLAAGSEYHVKQIPPAMRSHCGMLIGSKLSYHELRIPDGSTVSIYGCVRDGALRRCGSPEIAGALSNQPHARLAEGYGANLLSVPRMVALLAALLLGYLASTLLDLPPPPYTRPAKKSDGTDTNKKSEPPAKKVDSGASGSSAEKGKH